MSKVSTCLVEILSDSVRLKIVSNSYSIMSYEEDCKEEFTKMLMRGLAPNMKERSRKMAEMRERREKQRKQIENLFKSLEPIQWDVLFRKLAMKVAEEQNN